jgi:hypothetical protein
MNTSYTELLSTTLKEYKKQLVDNIFDSNAAFLLMKEKQKFSSGGERIVVPIMYATNETAGSYAGYDELDVTAQPAVTVAEYNWKQYYASITISGEEEMKNRGERQIINLLEAKTKQAEMSLVADLTTGFFGSGADSKDIVGLDAAIQETGTYGGIAGATYTYWQADTDETAETLSLADMTNTFNSCSKGGTDSPDIIVTDQTLFEKYESLMAAKLNINYESRSKAGQMLGDAGFTSLEFKGRPIVWDENCTASNMYFINSKHLYFHVMEGRNFEPTDFVKPTNQDARTAQILWMGNLVCDRRASLGAMRGKTA